METQFDDISPRQFEELIASVFEAEGYQVSVTSATRDGGVDVFAERENELELPDQWIIECKKYSSDRAVGVEVVRQLAGVKNILRSRNAVLVSTARFTKEAEAAAEAVGVDLVDRNKLIRWLDRLKPEKQLKSTPKHQFQSVFISHSHQDHEFVSRLNRALRQKGVRTWFAHENLDAGVKIHKSIFDAINSFDRLIIVLSENSIKSPWVTSELRRAMARQRTEQRDILFPISLMPYENLRNWQCFDADAGSDIASEIRQYLIPSIHPAASSIEFDDFVDKIVKGLTRDNST